MFNAYRMFYQQPDDIDLAHQFILSRLSQGESTIFFAQDEHGQALAFTQLYPSFLFCLRSTDLDT